MEIATGLTYKVVIDDCCVRGEFQSKLIKAKSYDDNDKLIDADTLEYGTELTFENGVQLKAEGGVKLEFIYQG